MYIGKIMHTNLITVAPNASLLDAEKLIRENPIDHLLVVNKKDKLVGIISDRDLKKYWASPATSLSKHELGYLLEKVEVQMIMSKTVITVAPDMTVERAAYIMQIHNVNALPVEENGQLVGIITSTDVMGVLLNAIGMSDSSSRISVYVKDSIGMLATITAALRDAGVNIQSVFSWPVTNYQGINQLILRIAGADQEQAVKALKEAGYKAQTQYVKDITPFLPGH